MLEIGQQIKRLREERRITGKDLARRIGLSQSQMSRLEKGQRRIDTEILVRIASALEVPPARFFSPPEQKRKLLTPRRERQLSVSCLHGEIGRRVRSARRQKHLTVDDLARKTGHTRAYVLAVEEGRRSGLDGDFIRKACHLLSIDPFTLLDFEEGVIHQLKSRIDELDRTASAAVAASRGEGSALGIPVLVGDEAPYPEDFDEDGNPVAAVEGYVQIPDLAGRPAFAVRVQGAEMEAQASPSFAEGDLAIFAADEKAVSGDLAFARFCGSRSTFRLLFQDDDRIVRLQARRPEVPPILLPTAELHRAWPLAAHVSVAR
ncbi:MAG: helix-turn-helix domain-containing protein [Planctomycetota bacterium]